MERDCDHHILRLPRKPPTDPHSLLHRTDRVSIRPCYHGGGRALIGKNSGALQTLSSQGGSPSESTKRRNEHEKRGELWRRILSRSTTRPPNEIDVRSVVFCPPLPSRSPALATPRPPSHCCQVRKEKARVDLAHAMVRCYSVVQELHHSSTIIKSQAASLAFSAEVAALVANPHMLRLRMCKGHLKAMIMAAPGLLSIATLFTCLSDASAPVIREATFDARTAAAPLLEKRIYSYKWATASRLADDIQGLKMLVSAGVIQCEHVARVFKADPYLLLKVRDHSCAHPCQRFLLATAGVNPLGAE